MSPLCCRKARSPLAIECRLQANTESWSSERNRQPIAQSLKSLIRCGGEASYLCCLDARCCLFDNAYHCAGVAFFFFFFFFVHDKSSNAESTSVLKRHDVGFQVVFAHILTPHIPQIGRQMRCCWQRSSRKSWQWHKP